MTDAAKRLIRLELLPDDRGVGVFTITQAGRMHSYVFREIPCEIGGRGFIVHKLGLGDVYHVRVGQPEDCSCECLGYYRHQRCKHVEGLKALMKAGLL